MQQKGIKLAVFGRVQGVGFRAATQAVANQLGVSGSVQNRPDGSVLIYAFAPKDVLAEFVAQIKQSPTPFGKVERISQIPIIHDDAKQTFTIKY